jgi:hypothetical protein
MRRNLLILLVFILLALASNAFGQKAQRVTFKRGATVATVSGYLKSYKSSKTFVVRLRKGQQLKVTGNRAITLTILNPAGEDIMDRAANCNGEADYALTASGDYKIEVAECQKADVWRGSFKLKISAK